MQPTISFHQHFLFVQQLAQALSAKITNGILTDALTTSKNELVLLFSIHNKPLIIKVTALFRQGFIQIEDTEYRKGSNAQPCFINLFNKKISHVEMHPANRSFAIHFGIKHQLIFKCYNALINVIEVENNKVVDVFRDAIQKDWQYNADEFYKIDELFLQSLQAIPITQNQFWINKTSTDEFVLNLSSNTQMQIAYTTNAIEATNLYARYTLPYLAFNQKKESLIATLQSEIQKLKKQIEQTELAINQLKHNAPYEETGHLLMANLEAITKGVKQIELFDFYTQKNRLIKLKEDLNAAENAAYYYRKAKNKKKEIAELEIKLLAYRTKLNQSQIALEQTMQATTLKELKQPNNTRKEKEVFPFKKFIFKEYEIWVGKNAQNNDLLTQKFAHKNDLWLHAKGVSGSHTIIKHKSGKEFTNEIITVAAQIAAYYSKHKGNALAPVSYVLKKYVRKPKGATVGSVVLEREEVRLVQPKLP